MDATPVTLAKSSAATRRRCAAASNGSRATVPRLGELPLGGTAVGTGLNTPPGFAAGVNDRLAVSRACR